MWYIFRVALGELKWIFTLGLTSSPRNSFSMLLIHSAFLLWSLHSHILLQFFLPLHIIIIIIIICIKYSTYGSHIALVLRRWMFDPDCSRRSVTSRRKIWLCLFVWWHINPLEVILCWYLILLQIFFVITTIYISFGQIVQWCELNHNCLPLDQPPTYFQLIIAALYFNKASSQAIIHFVFHKKRHINYLFDFYLILNKTFLINPTSDIADYIKRFKQLLISAK